MSAKDRRAKDAKMAQDLKKQGYPHGRRFHPPYPNSGGTTMVWEAGSSNAQRLRKRLRGR